MERSDQMNELKPCPFCGSDAIFIDNNLISGVNCPMGCCSRKTIKEWNARPTPKEGLKALGEEKVLNLLSCNQDYEQIPLKTRKKISEAICKTFGVPDVEWPEKKNYYKDKRDGESGNPTKWDYAWGEGYDKAIDACITAYQKAGGEK